MKPITIIQGAQWGSEAKGMVAGAMAIHPGYDYAVRTGAINAGHTVYYKGRPYAMQQIPVAWVNPQTKLVIGPGAYVHIPTLLKEISWIDEAMGGRVADRLYIDRRVSVHVDQYAQESADADRHRLIGATGKGCAEAIIHKIRDRGIYSVLLRDVIQGTDLASVEPWQWADTPEMLTDAYFSDRSIMLEGTQGELLDFHLGPWPYVTSRQTTPAAWVAEAGLSPSLQYEIVLIARTYPIRVAGNSGPMSLEISWPALARQIRSRLHWMHRDDSHPLWVTESALMEFEEAVREMGRLYRASDLLYCHTWGPEDRKKHKVVLSEYAKGALERVSPEARTSLLKLFELTTVTKKLRRIAALDRAQLEYTCNLIRPSSVVLTFLNYQYPELHCCSRLSQDAIDWARSVSPYVRAVTVGPESEHLHWI